MQPWKYTNNVLWIIWINGLLFVKCATSVFCQLFDASKMKVMIKKESTSRLKSMNRDSPNFHTDDN